MRFLMKHFSGMQALSSLFSFVFMVAPFREKELRIQLLCVLTRLLETVFRINGHLFYDAVTEYHSRVDTC